MFSPTLPMMTLAWLDAAIVVLAIVLTVGGWILNAVRGLREKARENQARQQSRMQAERSAMRIDGRSGQEQAVATLSSADELPGSAMTSRQRLDAQAARRRQEHEQARAQAAQRRQDYQQARSQAVRAGASAEPDNLTAAQKAARQRARQAYEQRAELLARQRQMQEEAARRHAAAQQKRQAAASPARPSRPQAARPAVAASTARPAVAPPLARQAANPVSSSPVSSPPMEVHRIERKEPVISGSQRRAADLAAARRGGEGFTGSVLRQAMNGKSMRAAFLLKEALDRPLALRVSDDVPGLSR